MSPENSHYLRCLEALKDSMFFKNLDSDSLRALLKLMSRECWKKDSFQSCGDSTLSTFYFIVSGRLKIYQINPDTGRQHTIFLLSKGDVFDILCLLDSEPHKVYCESIDLLEVLKIPITDMRNWILQYPKIHQAILYYLGTRIRMLEAASTDISLYNTLIRLSNLLLKNLNGQSRKLELINNLSNEEIASLIGTTRAVVNRHIQELKNCGAISVKRNNISIENVELLTSIAAYKFIP